MKTIFDSLTECVEPSCAIIDETTKMAKLNEENKMENLTTQQKSDISFAISGYLQDMPQVFRYGGGLDICLDYEVVKYPIDLKDEVISYIKDDYKKITGFDS